MLQIQFEDWFVIVDLNDVSGYVLYDLDGVRFSMAVQTVGLRGPSSSLVHNFSRNEGSVHKSETFPFIPERVSCVIPHSV